MKKIIVVWVVLLGVVLSGCGKTPNESTKISTPSSEQKTKTTETSAQSSEQKTKPAVKTSQPKSSTSSEVSQASDNISGVWMAKGKQDGVSSTWYFNNGQLTVNYVYHFSYVIAKNKDPHGYTVVTIKNNEGKQQHALLLKRDGSDFEGITAEGEAYNKYLADGTVPKGQIIEFTFQKNASGSMDEDKAYAAQTLVVKSSPGTSYKTLGVIKPGQLVKVYGGVAVGWDQENWIGAMQFGWSKILFNNQYAYVITSQLKFTDPYNWAPGIKSNVINSVYANGYVSKSDKIKLVELSGSSKNGSPGFYTMYVQQNGKGNWIELVTINCKTGWYHG
ncbi:hypothetical protein NDK43_20655 [Neobacillus pocheonensis]|uniref:MapZ extracellular C-terminal domain-containing protein n=1 Tax=Neobacillus pocheonensis TaxID=363869 RepID=A0ABT0WFJ7_9BACI|nr:hypothetical protein [Neobacillus pocheonensis]